jgi:hypothetical protein
MMSFTALVSTFMKKFYSVDLLVKWSFESDVKLKLKIPLSVFSVMIALGKIRTAPGKWFCNLGAALIESH